jgi:hypothetical protein
MVEARPGGVKATGQLWKGQNQNLVGHWTVAWAVHGRWSAPHHVSAVQKDCLLRSRFSQTLNVHRTVRFGLSLAAALRTVFLNSLPNKLIAQGLDVPNRVRLDLSLVAALLNGHFEQATGET